MMRELHPPRGPRGPTRGRDQADPDLSGSRRCYRTALSIAEVSSPLTVSRSTRWSAGTKLDVGGLSGTTFATGCAQLPETARIEGPNASAGGGSVAVNSGQDSNWSGFQDHRHRLLGHPSAQRIMVRNGHAVVRRTFVTALCKQNSLRRLCCRCPCMLPPADMDTTDGSCPHAGYRS